MKFSDLDLSKAILKAVDAAGYTSPSPIQEKAIQPILDGHDVMAAAQTGTGKTAAFVLPILERLSKGPKPKANQARALVLTPTRELAHQIAENAEIYGKHLRLSTQLVYGGVKINPQMMRLRRGADLLIATPGRLLDLHGQNAVKFSDLEVLVLDEADRMLDMGFIHDIKRVLKLLPKQRQNLLFSATFSDSVRELTKGIVNDPVVIDISPRNSTAQTISQKLYPVDKSKKTAALISLIKENAWMQVLVFCRTKHGANRLATKLDAAKIKAAAIHGNKSQNARLKALADFKANKIEVLVATDIAARGIDIEALPHVINVDLPNVSEDYVHRIGRTGRAGSEGEAVSLVSADEIDQLNGIERLIKKHIPREYLDGFEPEHELPASRALNAPVRLPKKPKKDAGRGASRDGRKRSLPSGQDTRKSADGKRNSGDQKGPRRRRSNKKPIS